ncbi:MAG TPA: S-layer homology domain-containing protein [Candidatus Limnocylindrales bacterium]|nr:S-layer homology domain-containing protein [Candidatus Limnocylindrales bacterium]
MAVGFALLSLMPMNVVDAADPEHQPERAGPMVGFQRGASNRLTLATAAATVELTRGLVRLRHADGDTLRLRFPAGGAPTVADPLPGRINQLIGTDPATWSTGARSWSRATYESVVPGVDLTWRADGVLSYELLVQPGGDAGSLVMRVDGATGLQLESDGSVRIQRPHGAVVLSRPVAWQTIDGRRLPVSVSHRIVGTDGLGVSVGPHRSDHPLVIDPAFIGYSTFLGGSGIDWVRDVAAGPDGSAYVAGFTASADLPTTSAHQADYAGGDCFAYPPCPDAFIAHLTPGGALDYLTYLGGHQTDRAWDIAIDSSRRAVVTGNTISADFPTEDPLQPAFKGGAATGDAFVAKLSADGSSLVYSTYLGGLGNEYAAGLALGTDGRVSITGYTDSADFPTTDGSFDESCVLQSHGSCMADAFVAQLAPDGQSIDWATYLGGEPVHGEIARGTDEAKEIAVAGDGGVVVVGTTRSSNFPVTTGAADVTFDGAWSDGFVARLSADGSTLEWATYLGGDYLEEGESVVIGADDRPMVVGKTLSKDFPTTADAHEPFCNGLPDVDCHPYGDGFFTIVSADGSELEHSSFLGGRQYDEARAIALDDDGDAWITGGTASVDFEVVAGVQGEYAGLGCFWVPCYDAFVRELEAGIWDITFSTFLGGFNDDLGDGISVANGNVVVGGYTAAEDFPTDDAIDTTCGPDASDDCGPDDLGNTIADGFVLVLAETPFTDIGLSSFADEIGWLTDQGITHGCAPDRFCPKGIVTRGQMAAFLARALELPASSTDHFTDDDGSTHEADINRLATAGITTGCAPGRFCPNGLVTRAQMASFLARALELPASSTDHFTDDEGNTHEVDINRLATAGITAGCAPGRFCPSASVTREHMAAFLYRALAP